MDVPLVIGMYVTSSAYLAHERTFLGKKSCAKYNLSIIFFNQSSKTSTVDIAGREVYHWLSHPQILIISG